MNLPGVSRRRGRGAPHRQRHPAAGRLCRQRGPGLRPERRPRRAGRERCPPRWCPRLVAASTNCPPARRARWTATRCRGRRPGADAQGDEPDLGGTMGWLAGLWRDVLGAPGRRTRGRLLRPRRRLAVGGPAGGRAARALPAADRRRALRPSPAGLAGRVPRRARPADQGGAARSSQPTPVSTQAAQVALSLPLATLTGAAVGDLAGARSTTSSAVGCDLALPWLVTVNWWWVLAAFLVFITPPGRMGIAVLGARMLLSGLQARHLPPRRSPSTCGCGWPSGWPRPAVRRTWPARRGWCTTPARWATRSARAWTCTRRRR